MKYRWLNTITACVTLAAFVVSAVAPACAQGVAALPVPGAMVNLSATFQPPVLNGIKVYADEPFRFDFILDEGDVHGGSDADVREVSDRLIRYFLAALTVPEKELWVNLSPYEKDRIISDEFGQTGMGRDLLMQDYLLKQITSSALYPEGETGKKFWARIYAKAQETYGTTDIPIDTFNKVWIVPAEAVVVERSQKESVPGMTVAAFVVKSRLKVMLESDYVAVSYQKDTAESSAPADKNAPDSSAQVLAREVIREVVVPELEKEINEGQNFSLLRQVYQAIILAAWYKRKIKESLLSSVYVDQKKLDGININDPQMPNMIWARYVESFKKGAYNYIKEEKDLYSGELIPRKYFSGGCDFAMESVLRVTTDIARLSRRVMAKVLQVRLRVEEKWNKKDPIVSLRSSYEEDFESRRRHFALQFRMLNQEAKVYFLVGKLAVAVDQYVLNAFKEILLQNLVWYKDYSRKIWSNQENVSEELVSRLVLRDARRNMKAIFQELFRYVLQDEGVQRDVFLGILHNAQDPVLLSALGEMLLDPLFLSKGHAKAGELSHVWIGRMLELGFADDVVRLMGTDFFLQEIVTESTARITDRRKAVELLFSLATFLRRNVGDREGCLRELQMTFQGLRAVMTEGGDQARMDRLLQGMWQWYSGEYEVMQLNDALPFLRKALERESWQTVFDVVSTAMGQWKDVGIPLSRVLEILGQPLAQEDWRVVLDKLPALFLAWREIGFTGSNFYNILAALQLPLSEGNWQGVFDRLLEIATQFKQEGHPSADVAYFLRGLILGRGGKDFSSQEWADFSRNFIAVSGSLISVEPNLEKVMHIYRSLEDPFELNEEGHLRVVELCSLWQQKGGASGALFSILKKGKKHMHPMQRMLMAGIVPEKALALLKFWSLPDDVSDDQLRVAVRLLDAGFLSPQLIMMDQLKAAKDPENLMRAWSVFDPTISRDFDPDDPLMLALEYNRFLRFYVIQSHKAKEEDEYTFGAFEDIVRSHWGKEVDASDVLSRQVMASLQYLSYEAKMLDDFIMDLKGRAASMDKKVMVVTNFTYGWFASIPLRESLERQGIMIVNARCGSTESHVNEYILTAAGKDRFFDQETIEFIMRERPVLVFVDGSNSFQRDAVGGGRYPDAHKAWVNNMMLINYVLAKGQFLSGTDVHVNVAAKDPEDHRDREHFLRLLQTPAAQKLLSEYQMAAAGVQLLEKNAYQVEYYNPMEERVSITKNGVKNARRVRAVVDSFKKVDIDALDLDQKSTSFVFSVNVSDVKMPSYMQQFVAAGGWKIGHNTADLDDHIDTSWTVSSEGVRRSTIMEDAYHNMYGKIAALVDAKEGKLRSGSAVVQRVRSEADADKIFASGKRFGGVLLDIDGTIKEKGRRIEEEVLISIVKLLNKGYKVGIISGRSGSVARILIDRLRRRMPQGLDNLYVFEQNGAYGYRVDGDEVLLQSPIKETDRQILRDKLENWSVHVDVGKVQRIEERSGIIAVYEKSGSRRLEMAHALRRSMLGWGLSDRYEVVDTGVNINIIKLGVNKGMAAEVFARACGLGQKDILKIGNSYGVHGNDYPMLILPGGVGVDAVDMTKMLLRRLLVLDVATPERGKRVASRQALVEKQAMLFRATHQGMKIAVVGASEPEGRYESAYGESLGAQLSGWMDTHHGWIMTGGVGGVGVDVFRGFSMAHLDRFSVVLPRMASPHVDYNFPRGQDVLWEVNRTIIGENMFDRHVGLAMMADVMVVLNGGMGTLHEAVTALMNNRHLVVLPHGGVGEQLYAAKVSGEIPERLLKAGVRPQHLSFIHTASLDTVKAVISGIDFSQKQNAALKGGIDLNPTDNVLSVDTAGRAVAFHVDPALLQEYGMAPGFTPVIMGVEPLSDVKVFLGIADARR